MKKYTNMLLVAMLAAMCFSIDASSGASVYSFKHDSDVLLGEDEVVALYVGGKLKHERADYISLSDALEDLGI